MCIEILQYFFEICGNPGYMVVYVRKQNYKCTKVIGSERCFCLAHDCSVNVFACLRGCTSYDDEFACVLRILGLGIPVASWISVASTNALILAESA